MRNKTINEYIEKENYIEIVCILGDRKDSVFIDKDDLDLVKDYKWRIHKTKGYPVTTLVRYENGKRIPYAFSLHNLLMGNNYHKGILVDHIDRNKLNNRRSNLRLVDSTTNGLNKSKSSRNTSGRTGVRYNKSTNSWCGFYEINGKKKTKSFNVNKYGEKQAYNMALKFREEAEIKFDIKTEK